ncbi:ZC2HC1A [Branchiostoma lanceolatum]|uniref:Zinc finger C2HC domain-containing protein 1A n=1 Tax=Branchiostoma lanceolatum TaxID=7740 RepID=A0A8J9Z535_BRALA|nr:ZC2HC1A [Branchiostoma lanceolatum]
MDHMQECSTCGRTFVPEVLEKHGRICQKNAVKKRKVFDSGRMRAQGTDIPVNKTQRTQPLGTQPKTKNDVSKQTNPVKPSKWRQQHEDFIRSIRAAKETDVAIKTGKPLPPPPPPAVNPDYIQCPHCDRRFNEGAGQRHIPWCAEKQKRLPTKKAQDAKARMNTRTQYRAPLPGKKKAAANSASRMTSTANSAQSRGVSSGYGIQNGAKKTPAGTPLTNGSPASSARSSGHRGASQSAYQGSAASGKGRSQYGYNDSDEDDYDSREGSPFDHGRGMMLRTGRVNNSPPVRQANQRPANRSSPANAARSSLASQTGKSDSQSARNDPCSSLASQTGKSDSQPARNDPGSSLASQTGKSDSQSARNDPCSSLASQTGKSDSQPARNDPCSSLASQTGKPDSQSARNDPCSSLASQTGKPDSQPARNDPCSSLASQTGKSASQSARNDPCSSLASQTGKPDIQSARNDPCSSLASQTGKPDSQSARNDPFSSLASQTGKSDSQPARNDPCSSLASQTGKSASQPARNDPCSSLASQTGKSDSQPARNDPCSSLVSQTGKSDSQPARNDPCSSLASQTGKSASQPARNDPCSSLASQTGKSASQPARNDPCSQSVRLADTARPGSQSGTTAPIQQARKPDKSKIPIPTPTVQKPPPAAKGREVKSSTKLRQSPSPKGADIAFPSPTNRKPVSPDSVLPSSSKWLALWPEDGEMSCPAPIVPKLDLSPLMTPPQKERAPLPPKGSKKPARLPTKIPKPLLTTRGKEAMSGKKCFVQAAIQSKIPLPVRAVPRNDPAPRKTLPTNKKMSLGSKKPDQPPKIPKPPVTTKGKEIVSGPMKCFPRAMVKSKIPLPVPVVPKCDPAQLKTSPSDDGEEVVIGLCAQKRLDQAGINSNIPLPVPVVARNDLVMKWLKTLPLDKKISILPEDSRLSKEISGGELFIYAEQREVMKQHPPEREKLPPSPKESVSHGSPPAIRKPLLTLRGSVALNQPKNQAKLKPSSMTLCLEENKTALERLQCLQNGPKGTKEGPKGNFSSHSKALCSAEDKEGKESELTPKKDKAVTSLPAKRKMQLSPKGSRSLEPIATIQRPVKKPSECEEMSPSPPLPPIDCSTNEPEKRALPTLQSDTAKGDLHTSAHVGDKVVTVGVNNQPSTVQAKPKPLSTGQKRYYTEQERVECPHCSIKLNKWSAQRHVPFCEDKHKRLGEKSKLKTGVKAKVTAKTGVHKRERPKVKERAMGIGPGAQEKIDPVHSDRANVGRHGTKKVLSEKDLPPKKPERPSAKVSIIAAPRTLSLSLVPETSDQESPRQPAGDVVDRILSTPTSINCSTNEPDKRALPTQQSDIAKGDLHMSSHVEDKVVAVCVSDQPSKKCLPEATMQGKIPRPGSAVLLVPLKTSPSDDGEEVVSGLQATWKAKIPLHVPVVARNDLPPLIKTPPTANKLSLLPEDSRLSKVRKWEVMTQNPPESKKLLKTPPSDTSSDDDVLSEDSRSSGEISGREMFILAVQRELRKQREVMKQHPPEKEKLPPSPKKSVSHGSPPTILKPLLTLKGSMVLNPPRNQANLKPSSISLCLEENKTVLERLQCLQNGLKGTKEGLKDEFSSHSKALCSAEDKEDEIERKAGKLALKKDKAALTSLPAERKMPPKESRSSEPFATIQRPVMTPTGCEEMCPLPPGLNLSTVIESNIALPRNLVGVSSSLVSETSDQESPREHTGDGDRILSTPTSIASIDCSTREPDKRVLPTQQSDTVKGDLHTSAHIGAKVVAVCVNDQPSSVQAKHKPLSTPPLDDKLSFLAEDSHSSREVSGELCIEALATGPGVECAERHIPVCENRHKQQRVCVDDQPSSVQAKHKPQKRYFTEQERVECPHCSLRLLKTSAERHIPFCEDKHKRLGERSKLKIGVKAKVTAKTGDGANVGRHGTKKVLSEKDLPPKKPERPSAKVSIIAPPGTLSLSLVPGTSDQESPRQPAGNEDRMLSTPTSINCSTNEPDKRALPTLQSYTAKGNLHTSAHVGDKVVTDGVNNRPSTVQTKPKPLSTGQKRYYTEQERVECPHCSIRLLKTSAEMHIPFCEDKHKRLGEKRKLKTGVKAKVTAKTGVPKRERPVDPPKIPKPLLTTRGMEVVTLRSTKSNKYFAQATKTMKIPLPVRVVPRNDPALPKTPPSDDKLYFLAEYSRSSREVSGELCIEALATAGPGVKCPHCPRRMSKTSFERHIPFCENRHKQLDEKSKLKTDLKAQVTAKTEVPKRERPEVKENILENVVPVQSDGANVGRLGTKKVLSDGDILKMACKTTKKQPGRKKHFSAYIFDSQGMAYKRSAEHVEATIGRPTLPPLRQDSPKQKEVQVSKSAGTSATGSSLQVYPVLQQCGLVGGVNSRTPTPPSVGRGRPPSGPTSATRRNRGNAGVQQNYAANHMSGNSRYDDYDDYDYQSTGDLPERLTQAMRLGSTENIAGKTASKFCHECGTRYPIPKAKFCCECGTRRIWVM